MRKRFTPATMRIPLPDYDGEEPIFYSVFRVGNWIPFGYYQNPEDEQELVPIPKELVLLEEAKRYIKDGYSYRDVARWLSAESGRSISHQGLRVRVSQDQKRARDELMGRQTLKQLVEVYYKTRRAEAMRLGRAEPDKKSVEEELLECIRKTT